MNELIELLTKKNGLTGSAAKGVIETVMTYLKGVLPAPLVAQIESMLVAQDTPTDGSAPKDDGGLLGKIGGMLGS